MINYFKKLKEVDIESLVTKEMCKEFKASKEVLADEVRKLLHLSVINDKYYVPSEAEDAVYHELLENKELRKKVEKIVDGKLIHRKQVKRTFLARKYKEFLSDYSKEFPLNEENKVVLFDESKPYIDKRLKDKNILVYKDLYEVKNGRIKWKK